LASQLKIVFSNWRGGRTFQCDDGNNMMLGWRV
jgi:hypothetical protein